MSTETYKTSYLRARLSQKSFARVSLNLALTGHTSRQNLLNMEESLTADEKIALIHENLQEVLKPEIIEDVIRRQNRPLIIYWGISTCLLRNLSIDHHLLHPLSNQCDT